MNKEQKQIKKVIDKAFSQLHVLSNITWTPYRDEIFNMNKKEIGATLCDNCEKIIYESEFNLINDYDVICDECKKQNDDN